MSKILSRISVSFLIGGVMALGMLAWPGSAEAEILPTTSNLGAPVGGTVLFEFSSDDSGARWLTFSGHLPRGLQVDPRPAGADPIIVSGVPEEAGTFAFTVAVDSVHWERLSSREYTLVVVAPPGWEPEPEPELEPEPVGCAVPSGGKFYFRHHGGLLPC